MKQELNPVRSRKTLFYRKHSATNRRNNRVYLSAAKNKMVSMRFLTEIIKLFIDSRNRREDWVVLVPKLSFFHREAVVQDFGGRSLSFLPLFWRTMDDLLPECLPYR